MTDKRAYFRMDVGYLSNPKLIALVEDHPRAVLLHLQCIAYAAQHFTDGKVPVRLAMRLACSEQCDLDLCVESGLLIPAEPGFVVVHDYLEHQRSADEAEKSADKARRAAQARWANAPGNAPSIAPSTPPSSASGMPREKRENKEYSSEIASDPDANPSDDVKDLCEHLAAKIVANGNRRPAVGKRWHRACRLLLEVDGKTPDQIRRCIDWSQADPFWSANVLSMQKLREKYDTLRAQAERQGKPKADDKPVPAYVSSPAPDPSTLPWAVGE